MTGSSSSLGLALASVSADSADSCRSQDNCIPGCQLMQTTPPLLRRPPSLTPCSSAVSPLSSPLSALPSARVGRESKFCLCQHNRLAAGVSRSLFSLLASWAGGGWPRVLGAQRGMSLGAEPPAASTESGKLLSPRREGEVRGRRRAVSQALVRFPGLEKFRPV